MKEEYQDVVNEDPRNAGMQQAWDAINIQISVGS